MLNLKHRAPGLDDRDLALGQFYRLLDQCECAELGMVVVQEEESLWALADY
jgi:hypothetical protein